MANREHVKIIKQGPDQWNKWRRENPKQKPDLRRADLKGRNLYEANLGLTDLREADLSWADLTLANLYRANLREAGFIWANLSEANLSETNLQEVDLSWANLSGADLYKANLREALFLNTNFSNIDLSQVKGLETCDHRGPSSVDHFTLIESGKLPEVFLKGCGFPGQFIDYLPSLLWSLNPIDFYSCFISHSVKDEKFAKQLYSDLQAVGIRCWYAPEDLKTGQKIRKEIHEAIRIHDKLLLVLSKNSIDSDWVEEEVETALQQEASRKKNNQDGLVLFPIRLDETVMDSQVHWAELVRTRHIADFRKWKNQDSREEAFKRLLRDLKSESNNDKSKP